MTALQMVAALGAVANGGVLMRPRLVRAIFDADGREQRRFEPHAVRRVVSRETARTLTRILVRVVDQGTGHKASIEGYEVAGKTGTAQKLDPATRRYSRAPGVLSFAGFAPADEPRIVMLVLLDEPRTERWGSEAAAPIFAAIAREVLRHLEVPPMDLRPLQIVTGSPAEPRAPGVTGTAIRLVSRRAPGEAEGARVMPDLAGRSLRSALAALAPLDLPVQIRGQGRVAAQSPAPGEPLEAGATARLTLTATGGPAGHATPRRAASGDAAR